MCTETLLPQFGVWPLVEPAWDPEGNLSSHRRRGKMHQRLIKISENIPLAIADDGHAYHGLVLLQPAAAQALLGTAAALGGDLIAFHIASFLYDTRKQVKFGVKSWLYGYCT